MFPYWNHALARAKAELAHAITTWRFRIVVALVAVLFHLAMFSCAGRERLDAPFNSSPDQAPYIDQSLRVPPAYQPVRHSARLVVARWDAGHYIKHALIGLDACPRDPATATDRDYFACSAGWFPAYGVVVGAIANVTSTAPDVMLTIVSCLFAIVVTLLWTSKWVVDRIGRGEAWAALVAFHFFPSAFYIVTPYTEAATLVFVLGATILLGRGRWLLAGFAIGAATGLRLSAFVYGLAFGIAALGAAWRRRRARSPDWWRPLAALPLAGWGFVATLVAFQLVLGDAFAFLRVHSVYEAGHSIDSWRILTARYYLRGFVTQHHDSVVLFASLGIVLLAARDLVRRLALEESLFLFAASVLAAGVSLVALARPDEYWGLNRYLLLCPIIFLACGVVARKHPALFVAWLALSAALYWHVELCSYVTQGRPDLCPCLGRVEWYAPPEI